MLEGNSHFKNILFAMLFTPKMGIVFFIKHLVDKKFALLQKDEETKIPSFFTLTMVVTDSLLCSCLEFQCNQHFT